MLPAGLRHDEGVDQEQDLGASAGAGTAAVTRRPGRRPHPGPDASPFALEVWRASEEVADVLDQFADGEERQRAAELIYRDADGTVRTRHRLLRPVRPAHQAHPDDAL